MHNVTVNIHSQTRVICDQISTVKTTMALLTIVIFLFSFLGFFIGFERGTPVRRSSSASFLHSRYMPAGSASRIRVDGLSTDHTAVSTTTARQLTAIKMTIFILSHNPPFKGSTSDVRRFLKELSNFSRTPFSTHWTPFMILGNWRLVAVMLMHIILLCCEVITKQTRCAARWPP